MIATATRRSTAPPLGSLGSADEIEARISDLSQRLQDAEAVEADLHRAEDAALIDGTGNLAKVRADMLAVRQDISDLRRLRGAADMKRQEIAIKDELRRIDDLAEQHATECEELRDAVARLVTLATDLRASLFDTFARSQRVDRMAEELRSNGRSAATAGGIRAAALGGEAAVAPVGLTSGLRELDRALVQLLRGNRLWLPSSPEGRPVTGRESFVRAMTGEG